MRLTRLGPGTPVSKPFSEEGGDVGSYMMWVLLAMVAMVGLVLLLFLPGIWVFALLALAVALVLGIFRMIAAGVSGTADDTSDVEERRDEFEQRERDRRRAR